MPTGLFKTFSAAEHRQILRQAAIDALAGERADLFGRLESSIVLTTMRDAQAGGVTVEFTLAERHDLPGRQSLFDAPAEPVADSLRTTSGAACGRAVTESLGPTAGESSPPARRKRRKAVAQ